MYSYKCVVARDALSAPPDLVLLQLALRVFMGGASVRALWALDVPKRPGTLETQRRCPILASRVSPESCKPIRSLEVRTRSWEIQVSARLPKRLFDAPSGADRTCGP
jgi:hypothetical protein